MKLVVVHDFADGALGAGATRCAIDGATAMAGQGMDVTFFAAAGRADPALGEAGVKVVALEQQDIARAADRLGSAGRGLWNRSAGRRMRDIVEGADLTRTVFHVHTWSKALSPAALRPLLGPGVKAVFHLHEYFAACPNGGFFDYRRMRICHRRPLGAACLTTNCDSRSAAHKAWRVARHAAMTAAAGYPARARNFILLSALQQRVLRPYLPAAAALFRMRNPVDVDRLPLQPRDAAAGFLFVGRVSREKGVRLLAEAFAGRDGALTVVGDGPELDWLKAALPGARFRGWLDRAGVAEEMRRAKALVFPSLWYEGMPMAVVEALACGLPVIAGDLSAAAELVADGENGAVFASGDAGALRTALARLDDPGRASALSAEAYRRYWRDPFSQARYAAEIAGVYERVLSNDDAASPGRRSA